MPDPLTGLFRGTATDPVFIYTGDYSLSIAESIQEINYNNLTGLPRKAYLESKALEIFSYQMQQYEDDLKAEPRRKIFRKADAMIIAGARDILVEKLTDPPTISELASRRAEFSAILRDGGPDRRGRRRGDGGDGRRRSRRRRGGIERGLDLVDVHGRDENVIADRGQQPVREEEHGGLRARVERQHPVDHRLKQMLVVQSGGILTRDDLHRLFRLRLHPRPCLRRTRLQSVAKRRNVPDRQHQSVPV